MKKIGAFIAIAGGLSLLATSCKTQPKMEVTKDGLMYKIIKDEPGDQHPKMGDFVEFHATIKIGDSVMANSYEIGDGSPFPAMLQEAPFKAYFLYGFPLLTVGDSAIFYTPVDSIKKFQQFDPWVKDTDTIKYYVKLVSIKTKQQFDEDRQRMIDSVTKVMDSVNAIQIVEDDKGLQDYFAKNNIKPIKSPSGVYYTIQKEGTGDNVQAGQAVSVKYTGMLMDGTTFDSNVDPAFGHTDPFNVVVGQGRVIQGWDKGLLLLKKGSKARLYIPSALGYGPTGNQPKIPGNANLIFDVEILDVLSNPTN